ncbi:MAG: peptidoglycan-binding protein [Deltaproteobacteria bacterium]|nr:peptidoglycan-binding protein [Deltaproteobacteria bacterium]
MLTPSSPHVVEMPAALHSPPRLPRGKAATPFTGGGGGLLTPLRPERVQGVTGLPTAGNLLLRVSPTQPRVPPQALGESAEPVGTSIISPAEITPVGDPSRIIEAQQVLFGLGFYRGPINGVMTGPTRAALRVFQSALKLPVTGHLERRTIVAMRQGRAPALGLVTQSVAELQQLVGLPVTGELDEATLGVIQEGLVPEDSGVPLVRFRSAVGPEIQP